MIRKPERTSHSANGSEGPTGDQAASSYIPHPELVDAAEVAVELGLPLLLTGEPGTGKTECAKWVGHHFRIHAVHQFVAKSTSVATDLFYTYDALGRFSASQLAEYIEQERDRAREPRRFVDYAALGKAIISSHDPQTISEFLLSGQSASADGSQFIHPGSASRSVVLIDEIDKAPRDFPNDLLDEIANMRFNVRELGDLRSPEITDRTLWPIIIITSNSERQLPGPFLRRCVFYHIPFPKRRPERAEEEGDAYYIEDIVAARLGSDFGGSTLAQDALAFFYHLRDGMRPSLGKKPATAELLNWLVSLKSRTSDTGLGIPGARDQAKRAIGLLLKNADDQDRGRKELDVWKKQ